MNILIIGGGGREHAIGSKLLLENNNIKLYFYPGNGGTKLIGYNLEKNYSISDLIFFSKKNNIELTIVGSENLLMEEIVDIFQFNKLKILGPHYLAARLEGDRIFSKSFMKKYGIRSPKYQAFDSYQKAIQFLELNKKKSLVIKTNGLASGKGVIITHNENEAKIALKTMMIEKKFGKSGDKVIIEEYLNGKEISIIALVNQRGIFPFLSSKDYKKIGEKDIGLNTGGMGAISPNPYFKHYHWMDFKKNILEPTLDGMYSENINFLGFLYFGLMLYRNKIYLLEYNTRMGDPETQSLLPIMKNNFLKLLISSLNQEKIKIFWRNICSCCVVLSNKGYPIKYKNGDIIKGIDRIKEPFYIAGARQDLKKNWITNGGRILNILGISKNFQEARNIAYKKIEKIKFNSIYYRRDIGLF